MTDKKKPLQGVTVVQIGGAVAGAWCGRMLAELGGEVHVHDPQGTLAAREEVPGDPRTRGLAEGWLAAGKRHLDPEGLEAAVAAADILILGEDIAPDTITARPRRATVDLSWYGSDGPWSNWVGSDLVVQALSGMVFPAGPVEGPPRQLGDMQSALVGGATGTIAALAGLLAEGPHRHMDVSILEACMVLGELQTSDSQYLDRPVFRAGLNRFSPTYPISIHKCAEGWLGITVITPAQWGALCDLIGRPDLGRDPDLATIYLREPRADELNPVFDAAFASKTAAEWARLGRENKVPLIEVPDAEGLIHHETFVDRGAMRPVRVRDLDLVAPASPLHVRAPEGDAPRPGMTPPEGDATGLLAGLRIADFSMGWAGPLATRICADLGAEVIKIEAGRYPDWWRATQWTEEAIGRRQFEESCRFAALNRGKQSVSFDLTTEEGRALARDLVAQSDAVIENHAAGVMPKLGMGWDDLSTGRDDLVMVSMSAFGSGNALSETRAYGSTLEQGSGMPSFRGLPGEPPVMGHIAYGDPVGGVYGAGAMLAALYHRQRTGQGQWLNLSHIEALLPFTAPSVLARGVTGKEPLRLGNRHVAMAPHGVFPSADGWLALSVPDAEAWRNMARLIGREDWADGRCDTLESRQAIEDKIDDVVGAWSRGLSAEVAAEQLQDIGVAAAPVLTPEASLHWPHGEARGFYHDTQRDHVGAQRQIALALRIDGMRPQLRGVAPFLGAQSRDVVVGLLGRDPADYERLLAQGVISHRPTALRQAG
ncbi:CoA transferase [Pseudooceanicola sp.]|uniref:CaiB/BaiF CoA-transferase family protein n=1 Tax=Pseudooceanicola sp. TaxID=1914328 RepID=UPI0035C6799D